MRYADGSWELVLERKKAFHYACDDLNEAYKWICLINRILSNQNDDATQHDQDDTISDTSENGNLSFFLFRMK